MLVDPKKAGLRIVDFGSSSFADETVFDPLPQPYQYIQSRYYRSPEILMGHNYTTSIDMWSLGCTLVELATGEPIFPGKDSMEQMSYICDTIGVPSAAFIGKPKNTKSKPSKSQGKLNPSKMFVNISTDHTECTFN
jgi:serine/threonine protein kinase